MSVEFYSYLELLPLLLANANDQIVPNMLGEGNAVGLLNIQVGF